MLYIFYFHFLLSEFPGASDPYVKIKCAGRLLHKSRTVHRELNPVWDESVTLPIEDPFQPLNFKVRDVNVQRFIFLISQYFAMKILVCFARYLITTGVSKMTSWVQRR